MWEDPIVKDVRNARREIEAECGDDFDQIYARAVEIQRRYKEKTVTNPPRSTEENEPVALESV
jgi:hypothetical protein